MRILYFQRIICGVLLLSGCGVSGPNLPPLTPVTGTVKINGKPVEGVVVVFHPSEFGGGKHPLNTAYGSTNEQGVYTLMHSKGEAGAEPGEYTVTFSRMAMPDGSPIPQGTEPAAVGARETLPERYRDPERTTESATVTTTEQTFDFELQSR